MILLEILRNKKKEEKHEIDDKKEKRVEELTVSIESLHTVYDDALNELHNTLPTDDTYETRYKAVQALGGQITSLSSELRALMAKEAKEQKWYNRTDWGRVAGDLLKTGIICGVSVCQTIALVRFERDGYIFSRNAKQGTIQIPRP